MDNSIKYNNGNFLVTDCGLAVSEIDLQRQADIIARTLLDGQWSLQDKTGDLYITIPRDIMRHAFLNILFADRKYDALIDTIDLMVSDNDRDRLRAEYMQTKIRHDRMSDALISGQKINDEYLFDVQFNIMKAYLSMLESRARKLGVDLFEDEMYCEVARVVEKQ